MNRSLLLLLAAGLLASGCSLFGSDSEPGSQIGPPPPGLILAIGTYSGECGGYCYHAYEVWSDRTVVVTDSSWTPGRYPTQRRTHLLSPEDYARLLEAFDAEALRTAEPVYGCPGCTDGGVEWVGATWPDGETRQVHFDDLELLPEPLLPYVEAMDALRAALD